jgi:AcrR family transcriptional regulator
MQDTLMYLIVNTVSRRQNVTVPVDRLTPERRRQLTREALVAAAAEVFTAKGFHAASLDEIADAAGFTRGAIYSNFGSKEELLFAVYDRLDDMTLAGMADAIDERGGDPLHDATVAAEVWARLLGRSRDIIALSLELRLYALRNPEARTRLVRLEQQATAKLAAFIEDMFERQRVPLRVSATDLAELGRAAVNGLEEAAAIDEENAARYRELIETLFVLLARAATDLPADS